MAACAAPDVPPPDTGTASPSQPPPPRPGIPAAQAGNPPPECRAQRYDFAGQGTFAELGLVGQSRADLPDPNRPAMIWVTRDLLPFDAGAPGGEVEMTRMLCFQFADGSGGTDWPINPAWQPPEQ